MNGNLSGSAVDRTTIDLRSDTSTMPTDDMRKAMSQAKVGDDSKGEDPTVNRLQDIACEMMGKETALFVPSGTMGNLVALMIHTNPGDEIIIESNAHIYQYENGGYASIARLSCRCIESNLGIMDPVDVEAAVHKSGTSSKASLLCLENTHTHEGGVALTSTEIERLASIARRHQIPVHLDGARLFNAAIAHNVDIAEYTKHVDSVMICLSKGLSAPVGSLLLGSKDFIAEAKQARKILGGSMRQAGIIAAAGIVALDKMVDRLQEDHSNAKWLAEHINSVEGLSVDMRVVQTNILYIDIINSDFNAEEMISLLKDRGILVRNFGERVRLVTHRGIGQNDMEKVFNVCKAITEAT